MSGPLSCPNGKTFAGCYDISERLRLLKEGKLKTGNTAIKKGLERRVRHASH